MTDSVLDIMKIEKIKQENLTAESVGVYKIVNKNLITIFEKKPEITALPASLVKVIVTICVLNNISKIGLTLDSQLIRSSEDSNDGSGSNLDIGDTISVYDALANMLVANSNVTANIIARIFGEKLLNLEGNYHPTYKQCIDKWMGVIHKKILQLNMKNTHFKSPSGLDTNSYSNVSDISLMIYEAYQYNEIKEIWRNKEYSLTITDINGVSRCVKIISNVYPVVQGIAIGGKSGNFFSKKTGNCCNMAYILPNHISGYSYIVIILKSNSSDNRIKDINYINNTLLQGGAPKYENLIDRLLRDSPKEYLNLDNTLNINTAVIKEIKNRLIVRFESTENYRRLLVFCCDVGRLDIVYYLFNYLDKNSDTLTGFIEDLPNIKRIRDFSKNPDILLLQKLAMNTVNINEGLLIKSIFFKNLKAFKINKETSYADNMLLSFQLNILLSSEIKLSKDECVEIIYYFRDTEKCEILRKNVCFLLLFEHAIKYNLQNFFTLPLAHFNQLTQIQYAITSLSFLTQEFKNKYFALFREKIKCKNNLLITKKKKFAVCVSGIYRNHKEALVSLKEKLIDPLEADVFIHTWDKMTYWAGYGGSPHIRRTLGPDAAKTLPTNRGYYSNLKKLSEFLPKSTKILQTAITKENDIEFLKHQLNPVDIIIENEEMFANSLTDPAGFSRLRGTLNQIKMFWGIKKSFDLALQKKKYDVIIRVRPDIKINTFATKERFANIENSTLYSRVALKVGISDSLFYGTDGLAYNFSRFVDTMIEKQSLSPFDDYPKSDSHALLALWVFSNNINLTPSIIQHSLLPNVAVPLPNLLEALQEDFLALNKNMQNELGKFINFLIANYCRS